MESLGYVLMYFALSLLLWQGLKAESEEEKNELIKQKKLKLPVVELYEGLPGEFATYVRYTRFL